MFNRIFSQSILSEVFLFIGAHAPAHPPSSCRANYYGQCFKNLLDPSLIFNWNSKYQSLRTSALSQTATKEALGSNDEELHFISRKWKSTGISADVYHNCHDFLCPMYTTPNSFDRVSVLEVKCK